MEPITVRIDIAVAESVAFPPEASREASCHTLTSHLIPALLQ
jgi:hypothetical protein